MKDKLLFYILIIALLLPGCISEFNAELPFTDTDVLIVEGDIIENSVATIQLSKSFPLDHSSWWYDYVVDLATINIIGSNGYVSPPATNWGGGRYWLIVGELEDNVEYGLRIEYDGNLYQSTLSKPLTTPEIDSVSWIQPERGGPVTIRVSTHDNSSGAKFFSWNYTEIWEYTARYQTTAFYNLATNSFYTESPAPYYYCWSSFVSNKFMVGSTEALKGNSIINKPLINIESIDRRLSMLYCVTVSQKAISKGAYEYYLNKIQLNDEMGGIFTPQPVELRGNITCVTDPAKKAMGYIEFSKQLTHQRIFISRSQVSQSGSLPSACELLTNEYVVSFLNETGGTYASFYLDGFCPALDLNYLNQPVVWAPAFCTDCRNEGGSIRKPDFWPNDH